MWSYWEQSTFIGTPDLLVIGSGIVGLSAAIHFKNQTPQSDVLVIEAGHLPSGASTKNAGFACFGSPSELLMDLKSNSPEEVFGLVRKRWDGLELLRNWIGEDHLNYEAPGSFELFADQEEFESCLDQLDFLNQGCESQLGFKPYLKSDDIISESGFKGFSGAIRIEGEGQIHTGQMMKSLILLAQEIGIRLINGLSIKEVNSEESGIQVKTQEGTFSSKKCLIATNGFAKQLLPELDAQPARAQVFITKPIKNLKFKGTYHFDEGYYYFRNVEDRVLFGGGRNLDFEKETTDEIDLNNQIQKHLEEILRERILPDTSFQIDQQWSGIMGIGTDKDPIVKKLDDNLFCAVKLGGMGVAIGTMVGREAAELIHEGNSPSAK